MKIIKLSKIRIKVLFPLFLLIAIITIIILLACSAQASVQINEIMYNPVDCSDSDCEWVELFNNASSNLNLNNCTFNNNILPNNTLIETNSFLIIVRDKGKFQTNFQAINQITNTSINVVESAMTLSNSGTLLSLSGSDFCNDSIDYSSYTNLANGNNYSIEKSNDGTWAQSLNFQGSPGFKNSIDQNLTQNNTLNNTLNDTNNSEKTLFQLNESHCDFSLSINLVAPITNSEEFEFEVMVQNNGSNTNKILESEEISVTGAIQDINGVIIKEYSPWKNQKITNQKTKLYHPNLATGVYQLTFNITSSSCNDTNQLNDLSSVLIAINPNYQKSISSFDINKLYLNQNSQAKWGDQILAKVILYKGDESKHAVELYVTKNDEIVSKRTKINLYNYFQESTLTLPIQLYSNCDSSISDGPAKLIVEGLNIETEEEFEISGLNSDLCTSYEINSELLKTENVFSLNDNQSENPNIETTNEYQEYQFLELPSNTSHNQSLNFTIQINSDDLPHNYTFYSYLYNGAWCYSCYENTKERNYSLKTIELGANQQYNHSFNLSLDSRLNLDTDYRLKVKFFKDNQKTANELGTNISIIDLKTVNFELVDQNTVNSTFNNSSNSSISNFESAFSSPTSPTYNNISNSSFTAAISGTTAYESTGKRTIALVPILLIISSILLLFLLWKAPHRNP